MVDAPFFLLPLLVSAPFEFSERFVIGILLYSPTNKPPSRINILMAEKKPPASADQDILIRNLRLAWNDDLTVWGDEPESSQPDESTEATPSSQDYSSAVTSLSEWMETGPIYEITVW